MTVNSGYFGFTNPNENLIGTAAYMQIGIITVQNFIITYESYERDIGNIANGTTTINFGSSIQFNVSNTTRMVLSNTVYFGYQTGNISTAMYVNGSHAALLSSGNNVIDLSTSNNFSITISNSITLTPINMTIGQSGIILLNQVGNAVVSFSSIFKWKNGIVPSNTLTANAVDSISYVVRSPTFIAANFVANYQ
jgi:hypothetical protein